MKKILFLLSVMPYFAYSQINLKVLDEDGKPVSEATVSYNNQSFTTDVNGFVKIPIADSDQSLFVQKSSFTGFNKNIKPNPKVQNVNVLFVKSERETEIEEVVFQKKGKPKVTDLTSMEISAKEAQQV
ncbi:MAG: TonB-dependent receptor, partial [Flavobacteriales bacterium]|nr:TonB-dependent receptor [Flavobacteriales bacterium]